MASRACRPPASVLPLPRPLRSPLLALGAVALAVAAVLAASLAAGEAPGRDGGAELPPVRVGKRLAERLHLAAGDTLTVSIRADDPDPERFVVAGIFDEPAEPAEIGERNDYVRLQLPDLERVARLDGAVDRISIALRDPSSANAKAFAAQIDEMAYGFEAYTAEELTSRASRSFVVIRRFHEAISWITIVGSGVFVLAILLLKVEEMRREAGVLRLIGIRRRTILASLCLEALILTLAGAAVSIGLGLLLSAGVNAYYQAFYRTTLVFSRVTPGIVGLAVAISIGIGIVSGLAASLRLVRRPPLELMRR
ncbi:MAG: ABC transporter permease [Candidatus Eisenbacteria bacterium]